MLTDWKTANVPARTRSALALLEAMTLRPGEINVPFIEARRREGLDDEGMRWAASVCFQYNFINRVADAFDFDLPDERGWRRLASALNFAGVVLPLPQGDASCIVGEDGVLRPLEVERGRSRWFGAPGKTTEDLRRSIDSFVAREWGVVRRKAAEVPQPLETYLRKLAKAAYRITDEDIEALRVAGYDDERIYEITTVGAMAAALMGLEAVYEASYGAKAHAR